MGRLARTVRSTTLDEFYCDFLYIHTEAFKVVPLLSVDPVCYELFGFIIRMSSVDG